MAVSAMSHMAQDYLYHGLPSCNKQVSCRQVLQRLIPDQVRVSATNTSLKIAATSDSQHANRTWSVCCRKIPSHGQSMETVSCSVRGLLGSSTLYPPIALQLSFSHVTCVRPIYKLGAAANTMEASERFCSLSVSVGVSHMHHSLWQYPLVCRTSCICQSVNFSLSYAWLQP